LVIAVDGPSAAGKGTLGRRLAQHLGLAYLDTGLLYRAIADRVVAEGASPEDEAKALAAARSLTLSDLSDPELRSERISAAASRVAAIPAVREAVLGLQRRFAAQPPYEAPGAVLDGRDIGTVVCPDAPVKIFVTGSPEARAERRHRELLGLGRESIYSRVLQDMIERDRRDRTRPVSPLVPAPDALIIDSSAMDAEAVFAVAVAHIAALGFCPAAPAPAGSR
jgi:cytidylate kinase